MPPHSNPSKDTVRPQVASGARPGVSGDVPAWAPSLEELLHLLARSRHRVWIFDESAAGAPGLPSAAGHAVDAVRQDEIAEDLGSEDPDDILDWAIDLGPSPSHPPAAAAQPPLSREGLRPRTVPLLAATRLVATLGSIDAIAAQLGAPGALTVIVTGDPALGRAARSIINHILETAAPSGSSTTPLVLEMGDAVPGSSRSGTPPFGQLNDTLAKALATRCPILLVAGARSEITPAIEALDPVIIPLAPLDPHMLAWGITTLRPDCSPVDERTLPKQEDAAALTTEQVILALRASDASAIAARLTLPNPPQRAQDDGPGLDQFPLPPPVREAVDRLLGDLRDWRAGRIPWKDVTRGFLLTGPPGTGKTELARLLARAAGIGFHATSLAGMQASGARSSDILREMRAVFARAAAGAPAIIFIDELDAVGDRARPQDHNSSWTDMIVAGLLDCLDGFHAREGVLSIAATNYPHKIDAALLRPGRFDTRLVLAPPDPDLLPAAFRWHLHPDLAQADLAPLARRALGLSGADIARLVRDARAAARRAGDPLALSHLEDALERLHPRISGEDLRRVAAHEAGHAIAAAVTGIGIPERIAITGEGGVTLTTPLPAFATRASFERKLVMLMAGRMAEQLLFGDISSGSGGAPDSDLARATDIAVALETSYGMGASLLWRGPPETGTADLRLDRDLRARVEAHLQTAEATARSLLSDRGDTIKALAQALIKRGLLPQEEIEAIIAAGDALRGAQGDGGPS